MSARGASYDPLHDCKLLGAVRALTGIRELAIVVHGRPGCHSGMLVLQALTAPQHLVNVVSSGMKSEDMTYGGEQRLLQALLNVQKVMKPKAIVVLVASAAGVMGEDVEGVVREARSRGLNVPVLVMECCGFSGTECEGYEEALRGLAKLMRGAKAEEREKRLVNLIGFRADEPHALGDLQELAKLVEMAGGRLNLVISWCSVDELQKAVKAEVNVVLGGDGIELAKILEEEYGIPYVVLEYPYGLEGSTKFVERLASILGADADLSPLERAKAQIAERLSAYHTFVEGLYGSLSAVVVGAHSRVLSFAGFLWNELGIKVRLAATRCGEPVGEVPPGCRVLVAPDARDLEDEIVRMEPDVIFGSTMERGVAARLRVPLFRFSYPVLDEIYLTDLPLVGPRGVLTTIEKLVNLVLRHQELEETAYYVCGAEHSSSKPTAAE